MSARVSSVRIRHGLQRSIEGTQSACVGAAVDYAAESKESDMDEIPLCPPWWPKSLWDSEWFPHPPGSGGYNPRNYPPYIDDVLVALAVNVLSYRLADQERAAIIRGVTVETIGATAQKLGGHPDEKELALNS